MSAIDVVTFGDSSLDNFYWMLEKSLDNPKQAEGDSVEGQLQSRLNLQSLNTYRVISHAYDGFTTSSVLEGDAVGKVLYIDPKNQNSLTEQKKAYLLHKGITSDSENYNKHPLQDLQKHVSQSNRPTYVVISVGGNDFRERLHNPFTMLGEVPGIQERYLGIVQEVLKLRSTGKDIRPILMFQYRLDAHDDRYGIYATLKVVGLFFSAIHGLSILGMGASLVSIAMKVDKRLSLMFTLLSAIFLAVSTRIIPLKVTKDILTGEQKSSMAILGGLMESFYRPVLTKAKKEGIPILDLPNTFNPYDKDLYIAQIEPSKKGGALIAEGLDQIIKKHDFSCGSKIYFKEEGDPLFTESENRGSEGWHVKKKPVD